METLAILVALLVLAALEGLYHLVRFLSERKERELRRRLAAITGVIPAGRIAPLVVKRSPFTRHAPLALLLERLAPARRLAALIEQADAELSVVRFGAYSLAGLGVGGAFCLSLGLGVIRGLLLGAGLSLFPLLWLYRRRASRSRKISEQLPGALEMMCRSLRAGHATPSAFQLAATELPMPIAWEFGRSYEEQRLGLSVAQATENMALRMPINRDLKIFAVSISVQQEAGGNLAEVLENNAGTLRDRIRFNGKLKALTAEGRASGLVLSLLPPGAFGLILMVNPEYARTLVLHPMGRLISIGAIVSWLLGVFWMSRLARVEF